VSTSADRPVGAEDWLEWRRLSVGLSVVVERRVFALGNVLDSVGKRSEELVRDD